MLHIFLVLLIPAMWLGWGAYWMIASADVKATQWREPFGSRLLHIVPLMLAAVLLSAPSVVPHGLDGRFLPRSATGFFIAVAMVAAGIGFAIWARRHLGRNWSGTVQVKEGHSLIRTGPYRLVRHPIYTGLVLAVAGSALAIGQWRGLIAFALVFVSLYRKLRVEEARMRETFPEYADYERHTAALIPFLL